jgi:hypothetical protein
MKCGVLGCDGYVPDNLLIQLPVGIVTTSYARARICNTCNRLHWADGSPVFDRQNHAMFFEDKTLTEKEEIIRT